MSKKYLYNFWLSLVAVILCLPAVASAYMSSANYTIYADSIGVSGGYTSGTNYNLEQTLGEAVVSSSTSASYTVKSGYQSLDREDLSLTISVDSISLGTLSKDSVSSASTVATVTSLSPSGYALTVGNATGNVEITVIDNEVTAGFNEYGFAVSGNDSAFTGDKGVVVGQLIASSPELSVGHDTTLTFKASRATAMPIGDYNQNVTLQLSSNF